MFRLQARGQKLNVDYDAFAREWEAAWNSHDLDRILSHYCNDICFRSRKAVALVGAGKLHGTEALRTYWGLALKKRPDLNFKVQHILKGHQMMVITYLNHRGLRAAETLFFDEEGLVTQASACHEDI